MLSRRIIAFVFIFLLLFASGCTQAPQNQTPVTTAKGDFVLLQQGNFSVEYPNWPATSDKKEELVKVAGEGPVVFAVTQEKRSMPMELAVFLEAQSQFRVIKNSFGLKKSEYEFVQPLAGQQFYTRVVYAECGSTTYGVIMLCPENSINKSLFDRVFNSISCTAIPSTTALKTAQLPSDLKSRSFYVGYTATPRSTGDGWVQDIFSELAQSAEVVLLQPNPPWNDLLTRDFNQSGNLSFLKLESKIARALGLKLYVAVDPTDLTRKKLVDVPDSIGEKSFANEKVKKAFKDYILWIARELKPDYLAVGVEVNMLLENNPDEFERYFVIYNELYSDVKRLSPAIKVFPTLQYDMLSGNWEQKRSQWELLDRFGKADFVAITSYPYLAFPGFDSIPNDYYTQLRQHTSKPIFIAESGYSSERGVDQYKYSGGEDEQRRYLELVARSANELKAEVWIYWTLYDPNFDEVKPPAGYEFLVIFKSIGLKKTTGGEKPAMQTARAIKALEKV